MGKIKLQSPFKYSKDLDSNGKTSLVNQASTMKSKNNAQYIMGLVQGGNINQKKFELIS